MESKEPPRRKKPDDILPEVKMPPRPDPQQAYDDSITQYELGEPDLRNGPEESGIKSRKQAAEGQR